MSIERKIIELNDEIALLENQRQELIMSVKMSNLKPKDRFHLIHSNGKVQKEDVFVMLEMNYFLVKDSSDAKCSYIYFTETEHKLFGSDLDLPVVRL